MAQVFRAAILQLLAVLVEQLSASMVVLVLAM
jgi:hypothetical protein